MEDQVFIVFKTSMDVFRENKYLSIMITNL